MCVCARMQTTHTIAQICRLYNQFVGVIYLLPPGIKLNYLGLATELIHKAWILFYKNCFQVQTFAWSGTSFSWFRTTVVCSGTVFDTSLNTRTPPAEDSLKPSVTMITLELPRQKSSAVQSIFLHWSAFSCTFSSLNHFLPVASTSWTS